MQAKCRFCNAMANVGSQLFGGLYADCNKMQFESKNTNFCSLCRQGIEKVIYESVKKWYNKIYSREKELYEAK